MITISIRRTNFPLEHKQEPQKNGQCGTEHWTTKVDEDMHAQRPVKTFEGQPTEQEIVQE